MQRYKCHDCAFTFSEADRSWDSAIDSGRCPKCSEPLCDFPVPVRGYKGKSAVPLPPPSIHKSTPSAQPNPSVSVARFCSSCGTPVAPGSNFCAQCGAALPTSRSAEPVSSKAADNSQSKSPNGQTRSQVGLERMHQLLDGPTSGAPSLRGLFLFSFGECPRHSHLQGPISALKL